MTKGESFVWIKNLLFLVFTFFLTVSCSQRNENSKNIANCISGWALRYDKVILVEESLSKLDKLDEFIVIKQGIDASGGGQYWFLLIGVSGREGVLLNMADSINQPILDYIEYDLAKSFIDRGRLNIRKNKNSELNLDVNHVPCTFFKYQDGVEGSFEYSFSGFSNHMKGLHGFIQELAILASEMESGVELDSKDPLVNKNDDEVIRLKQKFSEDHFFELKSLNQNE
jgi:hypothetical protein